MLTCSRLPFSLPSLAFYVRRNIYQMPHIQATMIPLYSHPISGYQQTIRTWKFQLESPRRTLSDMAVQSQYGQHPLLSVQSKPWKGSFPDTGITQGPLFSLSNGSLLSRRRLSGYLQAALPSLNLNTHSFRIGGASAAAAMGIPDSTIQILGRWASNAYRTYLRLPNSTIQHACVQMAQSSPHPRTYLPHNHTSNLEEHECSVRE